MSGRVVRVTNQCHDHAGSPVRARATLVQVPYYTPLATTCHCTDTGEADTHLSLKSSRLSLPPHATLPQLHAASSDRSRTAYDHAVHHGIHVHVSVSPGAHVAAAVASAALLATSTARCSTAAQNNVEWCWGVDPAAHAWGADPAAHAWGADPAAHAQLWAALAAALLLGQAALLLLTGPAPPWSPLAEAHSADRPALALTALCLSY